MNKPLESDFILVPNVCKNPHFVAIALLFVATHLHAASAPEKPQTGIFPKFVENFSFGAIGGVNFSDFHYDDKGNNRYNSSLFTRPTGGIYGRYRISRSLDVRPEFTYVGKGQSIDEANFNYEISVNSFDFRLPLLYRIENKSNVTAYLEAGPYLGIPFGGGINYSDSATDWSTAVSDASIAPVDFGAFAGFGLDFRQTLGGNHFLMGFDVTYNYGFQDTYSDKEHSKTSQAINDSTYAIRGSRNNTGLMVRGFFGVPFGVAYKTFCDDCDPEAAFRAAMRLYKRRQYLDASYAFGRIVIKWPVYTKNDSAMLFRGKSLENMRMHVAAIKTYEMAISRFDTPKLTANYHFQLQNIAYKDSNWEEVHSNHKIILTQFPKSPVRFDADYIMGQAYFNQGMDREAKALLERIPYDNRNAMYAQHTIGLIYFRHGMHPQAQSAFEWILRRQASNRSETELMEDARIKLGHIFHSSPNPMLIRAMEHYSLVPPNSVHYDEAQLGIAWCFVRNAGTNPRFWDDANRHAANIPETSILFADGILVKAYSQLVRKNCDSAATSFQSVLDMVGRNFITDEFIASERDSHANSIANLQPLSETIQQLGMQLPTPQVLEMRRRIQPEADSILSALDRHARFEEVVRKQSKFRKDKDRLEQDATYGLATSKNCQERAPSTEGGF